MSTKNQNPTNKLTLLSDWSHQIHRKYDWGITRPQSTTSLHPSTPKLGMAFSPAYTQAMVRSVFRKQDESRIWNPNIGSVSPTTIDQFSSEIIARQIPIAQRYLAPESEGPSAQHDMPLSVETENFSTSRDSSESWLGTVSLAELSQTMGLSDDTPDFVKAGLVPSAQPNQPIQSPSPLSNQSLLQRTPLPASEATRPTALVPGPKPRPLPRRRNVRPLSRREEMLPNGDFPTTPEQPDSFPTPTQHSIQRQQQHNATPDSTHEVDPPQPSPSTGQREVQSNIEIGDARPRNISRIDYSDTFIEQTSTDADIALSPPDIEAGTSLSSKQSLQRQRQTETPPSLKSRPTTSQPAKDQNTVQGHIAAAPEPNMPIHRAEDSKRVSSPDRTQDIAPMIDPMTNSQDGETPKEPAATLPIVQRQAQTPPAQTERQPSANKQPFTGQGKAPNIESTASSLDNPVQRTETSRWVEHPRPNSTTTPDSAEPSLPAETLSTSVQRQSETPSSSPTQQQSLGTEQSLANRNASPSLETGSPNPDDIQGKAPNIESTASSLDNPIQRTETSNRVEHPESNPKDATSVAHQTATPDSVEPSLPAETPSTSVQRQSETPSSSPTQQQSLGTEQSLANRNASPSLETGSPNPDDIIQRTETPSSAEGSTNTTQGTASIQPTAFDDLETSSAAETPSTIERPSDRSLSPRAMRRQQLAERRDLPTVITDDPSLPPSNSSASESTIVSEMPVSTADTVQRQPDVEASTDPPFADTQTSPANAVQHTDDPTGSLPVPPLPSNEGLLSDSEQSVEQGLSSERHITRTPNVEQRLADAPNHATTVKNLSDSNQSNFAASATTIQRDTSSGTQNFEAPKQSSPIEQSQVNTLSASKPPEAPIDNVSTNNEIASGISTSSEIVTLPPTSTGDIASNQVQRALNTTPAQPSDTAQPDAIDRFSSSQAQRDDSSIENTSEAQINNRDTISPALLNFGQIEPTPSPYAQVNRQANQPIQPKPSTSGYQTISSASRFNSQLPLASNPTDTDMAASRQQQAATNVALTAEPVPQANDIISNQVFRQADDTVDVADADPDDDADDTEADDRTATSAQPDITELARQIYPLVKRMLVIERERRPRQFD